MNGITHIRMIESYRAIKYYNNSFTTYDKKANIGYFTKKKNNNSISYNYFLCY